MEIQIAQGKTLNPLFVSLEESNKDYKKAFSSSGSSSRALANAICESNSILPAEENMEELNKLSAKAVLLSLNPVKTGNVELPTIGFPVEFDGTQYVVKATKPFNEDLLGEAIDVKVKAALINGEFSHWSIAV